MLDILQKMQVSRRFLVSKKAKLLLIHVSKYQACLRKVWVRFFVVLSRSHATDRLEDTNSFIHQLNRSLKIFVKITDEPKNGWKSFGQ